MPGPHPGRPEGRQQEQGFTAEATIPRGTAPGKHKLYAGCDAGSSGTTMLNVLDPEDIETAADTRQAYGPQPPSELAMWAGLFAGLAVLVASVFADQPAPHQAGIAPPHDHRSC